MSIKNDAVMSGGVALAVLVILYLVQQQLSAAVPKVVKDGIEAVGQLGQLGGNMVVHPLDTFGISPGVNSQGVPTWEQSYPWATSAYTGSGNISTTVDNVSNDPTSNNPSGMNFNAF